MIKPLTQADMKYMGCATPGCTHDHSVLFVHGRCHPNAPVDASYTKATGTLTFRCARCKELIMEALVAPGVVQ